MTIQSLLCSHPNAGVIISGDRNGIEIFDLMSIDSSFSQIMQTPTRGFKILDVIITNLSNFYNEPTVIPAISPDKIDSGKPSDHKSVLATPHIDANSSKNLPKEKKIIRPLPDSLISVFGRKII